MTDHDHATSPLHRHQRAAAAAATATATRIHYCSLLPATARHRPPENILFKTKDADSELVIIDFGLAGEMRPGTMEGKVKVDKDDAHSEHVS